VNPLADSGLPRFFAVSDNAARLPVRDARGAETVRFYGRSLAGMQKEALVRTSAGGAWRLASDEGAYLNGLDEAPCPLAFMTTGMAASLMDAIQIKLATVGIGHRGVRLTQDNYYTMQGSMPRRTMIGGAKPVELDVEIAVERDAEDLKSLVTEAVAAAPVSALIRQVLRNTFTLTVNGREVAPDAAPYLGQPPLPDPRSLFDEVVPAGTPAADPLVARDGMTPVTGEATSHEGSSYAPEQQRTLHLRGICMVRPDGVKVIEQHLYNPHGSIFRLLSDEAPTNGGGGRAPDANSYIAAGIGFCFMTQFGRFAKIIGKKLNGYRIVQDTWLGVGHADPVETHVYLDTPEDDAFAREVLDVGEQTCFLHALCRTAVPIHVRIVTHTSDARISLGGLAVLTAQIRDIETSVARRSEAAPR
jgi:uncharacterized OsmC-like protein